MKIKISYYIIMTIDIYDSSLKLTSIKPSFLKKDFRVTESIPEPEEGIYKHRKYIGIVSAKKIKLIYDELGYVDTCDTMGSLTDIGWLPAISWDSNDDYGQYRMNLYVSPIIENQDDIEDSIETLDVYNKKIKINQINEKIENILKNLKNINENDADHFIDSFEVDFDQLEIYFEEFDKKEN